MRNGFFFSTSIVVAALIARFPISSPEQPGTARIAEHKPEAPARIVLSGNIQAVEFYMGPVPYWVPSKPLSAEDVNRYDQALIANPDDVCARGRLIAFSQVSRKPQSQAGLDHQLWMVSHHPEWNGFLLPKCW